jgi:hypothetical protein
MFIAALSVFMLSLISFVIMLAIGGPAVRASEEKFGIAPLRDALKGLRIERDELKARAAELIKSADKAESQSKDLKSELASLEAKIAKSPPQIFELVCELGTGEHAGEPFEFIISRTPRSLEGPSVAAGERFLWSKPRHLRVWARNPHTAESAATSRYQGHEGYVIRLAERIDQGRP